MEGASNLVVLAGLVREAVLLHVIEDTTHITAIARPTAATVDEHLGCQNGLPGEKAK